MYFLLVFDPWDGLTNSRSRLLILFWFDCSRLPTQGHPLLHLAISFLKKYTRENEHCHYSIFTKPYQCTIFMMNRVLPALRRNPGCPKRDPPLAEHFSRTFCFQKYIFTNSLLPTCLCLFSAGGILFSFFYEHLHVLSCGSHNQLTRWMERWSLLMSSL